MAQTAKIKHIVIVVQAGALPGNDLILPPYAWLGFEQEVAIAGTQPRLEARQVADPIDGTITYPHLIQCSMNPGII
jgi:hypothetical protein